MVFIGLVYVAGSFGKGYTPESIFKSAPLENSRSFPGDCDGIVVMDSCTLVAFMEDGDISIVSEGADAEEQVG